MSLAIVTHLNFRNRVRDALGFYHSAFGGDLTIVSHAEAHSIQDPAAADQVMWGQVASTDGFRNMAFDMPSFRAWSPGEDAFYVSVSSPVAKEISSR